MKTLLLSTFALTLAVASPNLVSAGGGNKGGGNKSGGNRVSSYLGNFGGNQGGNNNGGQIRRKQGCNSNHGGGGYPTNNGYPTGGNYLTSGQAYEPFHSYYFVQPGDTFYEVSLKEYGSSGAANYIARYNRLASNSALVPGQRLMLPSVAANGTLRASRAPAPESLANSTANFAAPQAAAPAPAATPATDVAFATADAALPSVSVGSSLALDGVEFGDAAGSVRLKFGPVSLPVTVLEWTATSVKVELPAVELDSATPSSIDVFRADGTLASQSQVNLTPAGGQVAQAE
ncbi:MAG: LysM domain-containing protein [Pirellulales bacterium]